MNIEIQIRHYSQVNIFVLDSVNFYYSINFNIKMINHYKISVQRIFMNFNSFTQYYFIQVIFKHSELIILHYSLFGIISIIRHYYQNMLNEFDFSVLSQIDYYILKKLSNHFN